MSGESQKYILDATCGSRMMWFDKNNKNAVFMDNRIENGTLIWKSGNGLAQRHLDVNPDVIADFTNMPFEDNAFYLVVFDPPHFLNIGVNSWMCKKYGKLPENWKPLIRDGFRECMRVLKPFGTLVFKWSEVDIKTSEIIAEIGITPLFGHKSGKQQGTHWMCFMKGASDND